VLVDANILLYSIDEESPFHVAARDWMVAALNGPQRVGIPWISLWAFLRIGTNPRALSEPLTPGEAWEHVDAWLDAPATWIPEPGRGHRTILGSILPQHDVRAGLVTDAVMAAICIEHGLTIISADSDFARFRQISWVNPVAPG
jgi:toxin-antitoxin system PIN domain toxin